MIKRSFDIVVSLAAIALLWPVMIIVALAIGAERQGPVLIVQQRIGREGKPFTFAKFRTLPVGTPQRPTHEIDQNTASSIGRFLRNTKLDELPQLVHVLAGRMSMVGPRPCLQSQSQLINERESRGVLAIRPGISGLAQVRGVDMSDPEKLARIDAIYARRQNTCLDVCILAETARIALRLKTPSRRA